MPRATASEQNAMLMNQAATACSPPPRETIGSSVQAAHGIITDLEQQVAKVLEQIAGPSPDNAKCQSVPQTLLDCSRDLPQRLSVLRERLQTVFSMIGV